jgi:hypothetical protein
MSYGRLVPHGKDDATTGFTRYPRLNYGVVTDQIVVVDIDPRNGGDRSGCGSSVNTMICIPSGPLQAVAVSTSCSSSPPTRRFKNGPPTLCEEHGEQHLIDIVNRIYQRELARLHARAQ